MSAGASPQTPIGGAYSASPDPLSGFKGLPHGRKGTEGRSRRGGKAGGMGKWRGIRKEGKRGEVGGIAPWLLLG